MPCMADGKAMAFGCTALALKWQNSFWRTSTRRNSGTWLTSFEQTPIIQNDGKRSGNPNFWMFDDALKLAEVSVAVEG